MSKNRKLEILSAVDGSKLPISQAMKRIDIPSSTLYRWKRNLRQYGLEGLQDKSSGHTRPWNTLLPEERDKVREIALLNPEWSTREVALHISDTSGFTVSESSVFRILKKEDWRKSMVYQRGRWVYLLPIKTWENILKK